MQPMTDSHPYADHPLNNQHKCVGLMFGSMASAYMSAIMLGASDYAQQHGYNMISFSGGPFANPEPDASQRDRLFDVPHPALFDGLIVTMGSLSRYIDEKTKQAFLARYTHLPIVNIGSHIDGISNVRVDNAYAYRDLMRHLIKVHGYRKIAFSSGPVNHESSNEKLRAYCDVLLEYDIEFNPDYIFHGNLTGNLTDCGVSASLDERHLELDAIVAVNDVQAFLIMDALKQRGLRVPQDIAVTGCMGTAESFYSDPPLTTIKEPMYELGRSAAEAVIAQIEGRAKLAQIVVPNMAIIRQSCGCDENNTVSFQAQKTQNLTQTVLSIAQKTKDNLGIVLDLDEMHRIAHDLETANTSAAISPVLDQLEVILTSHVRRDAILGWLAAIPPMLIYLAEQHFPEQATLPHHLRLEKMLNRIMQKVFVFRNGQSEKYINSFRELSICLNVAFNIEVIKTLLVREMKISDFSVNVFEDKNDVTGFVHNVLSIRNQQLSPVPKDENLFPAHQLLPRSTAPYVSPFNLIVLPMLFRSEAIGYIVMNVHERKGVVYENLQSLISGALKNETQIQELKEAEEKFSDIAHSTSDWLWEIDQEYRYTYCSSGVENVLGYSAEEMIGQTLFEHVIPSEQDYIYTVTKYLIPQQKPLQNLESINTHKEGHPVTLVVSGKPIIKNGECIGYRGAFKDTTAIKDQEFRIRQLAYHDMLTGLPNRTLFHDRLKMTLAMAQREHHSFAVLFLDLDRFKYVNDTLGHEAGDSLLKMVATRLQNCMRETDTLARLGGDEFTMILSNIEHIEAAANVAQRIVYALSAPIDIQGQTLFITTSIGIATYPHDGADTASLIKNADKAMYKAKEQGKNRYVFYDAQMGDKSQRRMLLESLLHQAIQHQLFTLHYQPQVSAHSGTIIGVEALIRLYTPDHGYISPLEFISLAEEVGLIEIIGLWVFETACRQAHAWEQAGYAQRVAINVSARQLKNPLLSTVFINIVQHFGVSPHLIEIEITENAVIDNEDTAKAILDELHAFGFKIAIDDFGTGYSSLSSLRKFPIDTVKIDRSFINDSTTNTDSAHIVSAIVHIAQSMQLNVIAEGVETIAQLNMLREIGCNEIQGYLFAKPVPAEQLSAQFSQGQFSLNPTQ